MGNFSLCCVDDAATDRVKIPSVEAKLVNRCRNIVAKNLIWDEESQSLIWIDIEGRKIWILDSYEKDEKIPYSITLQEKPGCFAMLKKDKRLVMALERRLVYVDRETGQLETIVPFDSSISLPTDRPNDGRCDRAGKFLVLGLNQLTPGNMKDSTQEYTGLYCIGDRKSGITSILPTPVLVLDGLCFNNAGNVMYFCNVTNREILAFDYDSTTGTVSGQRQFYCMKESDVGFPSGATVDSEDCLWSAQCGGGRVVRHSQKGEITFVVELPVENPTAVAFGGKNLDQLFIITSIIEKNKDKGYAPNPGSLFVASIPGVKGVSEPKYEGSFQIADSEKSACTIS